VYALRLPRGGPTKIHEDVEQPVEPVG